MTNKTSLFLKFPTAIGRMCIVIINNIYCIPTYVIWMGLLIPLKCIQPDVYYKIEGIFFHWLLAVVSMWSYTAGYDIVEVGDSIDECINKRTLVIANHQSTADVPLLMANFNTKDNVLPNIMWIMDRLFKYTNFGVVSVIHQDFFIASGRKFREQSINALRHHLKSSFLKYDRKWIVLFPEGGFLRKRKEVSHNFAKKNNLPLLDHVTIPRVRAMETIMDVMSGDVEEVSLCPSGVLLNGDLSSNKDMNSTNTKPAKINKSSPECMLEYILDITIAYPNGKPLDLPNILHGWREPCKTYVLYRLYKASEIPKESTALTEWLYERFIEKNWLLDNFYKKGVFYTDRTMNAVVIQQDMLRFLLINMFFITSTYIHYQLFCTLYRYCAFFISNVP